MKKLFALILASLLLFTAAACAQKNETEQSPVSEQNTETNTTEAPEQTEAPKQTEAPEQTEEPEQTEAPEQTEEPEQTEAPEQTEEPEPTGETIEEPVGVLSGGWQVAADHTMNEELRAIFDKALEGLVGVNYVPIACLGTQVVAGTNYCFLAQGTVVYPGATPTYMLIYVYEDLSGNAEIMNIADMPIIPNGDGTVSAPGGETLMGGWFYSESYEITEEIEQRFGEALNDYGYLAVYVPVADLGGQVVAGYNRCILVRFTERTPEALPQYKLMYVYEPLEGTAQMLNVLDFDIGALCTYGA